LVPEDGYVPADSVYVQSEDNDLTTTSHIFGASNRKVSPVEPGDSYIPAERISPQPTHDTSEVCYLHLPPVTSQNCVPPESSSADSDARSEAEGSKLLVASVSSESEANLSSQDSFVPADMLTNMKRENLVPLY
jgi:hypothetical protein